MQIKIDFNKNIGNVKPMNAVCCGPKTGGFYLSQDATKEFKDLSISYVRLHDIEGCYGSNQFVDIHCIFPDFDADVDKESSYNFKPTDKYLLAIFQSGAKVFFRLGESIDHYENKLYVRPPKDYLKWAMICEHIIRHYNYGWAMGFYMEIDHWEIWNEPEGHAQWTGRWEEFIELYSVTSKYLKKCYPNIKVGGYSAFGFYTETSARFTRDIQAVPLFRTITLKMKIFFEVIKQNNAPLDFFSWHCYAHCPDELAECSNYIRKFLDDNGYKNTESYLTEYNTYYSLSENPSNNAHYVAELLAGLISADDSPMDICFYYALFKNSIYNGLFYYNVVKARCEKLAPYNSMKFFSNLYVLSNKVETNYEKGKGFYCLSAKNDKDKAIAVSCMDFEDKLNFKIDGFNGNEIKIVSVNGKGNKKNFVIKKNTNNEFEFCCDKYTIYYLSLID